MSTDDLNATYEAAVAAWMAAIAGNPMASAEDVEWLGRKSPLAALRHPNCPVDLWWEIAVAQPYQAEASPLYPLLTLEAPERWEAILATSIDLWLQEAIGCLSFTEQQILAADCVEHILPIFARAYPDDQRPREAIRVRRLWAQGEVTNTAWAVAADDAAWASTQPERTMEQMSAQHVAGAAAHTSALYAINAASAALIYKADIHIEKKWQRDRLLQLINKEEDYVE